MTLIIRAECPKCGASPGQRCTSPSGAALSSKRGAYHRSRIATSKLEQCENCGAGEGMMCRGDIDQPLASTTRPQVVPHITGSRSVGIWRGVTCVGRGKA